MNDRPVYSTNKSQSLESQKKSSSTKSSSTKSSSGPLRVRRESKGRGGKTATILFNLPFRSEESKVQMKELQNVLACGASLKDGEIILQGDFVTKVLEYYSQKNVKIVHSGG